MKVDMYGIPNCDTIRKARKWLTDHGIVYEFHDYKKDGVDTQQLKSWVDQVGWEVLLNKRGATWRKLDDADKAGVNRDKSITLMSEYPSMIKRPVLIAGDNIEVGFSARRYRELLA